MYKYFFFTLLCCAIIGLYSCENVAKASHTTTSTVALTNAEAAKYYQQAIAIHDEVMPKMGKMDELKEKLEKKLTTTRFKSPNEGIPYQAAIKNLETADDMMMDVMAEMKEPDAAIPADQAIKTMTALNQKANDMKNFMLKTIDEAEVLLKEKK
jgi:hypothetical protein